MPIQAIQRNGTTVQVVVGEALRSSDVELVRGALALGPRGANVIVDMRSARISEAPALLMLSRVLAEQALAPSSWGSRAQTSGCSATSTQASRPSTRPGFRERDPETVRADPLRCTVPHQTEWHSLSPDVALARLASNPTGLAGDEAARRLACHGPNALAPAAHVGPRGPSCADQFKNVLIVILLVAAALSAFLGHGVEAVAIAVIVLFAVLLGFVQEYRAERAIEACGGWRRPRPPWCGTARRWRCRRATWCPATSSCLRAGDRVPADARLIEAVNLQVDEAALTGESVPVEKHDRAAGRRPTLAVGDRSNMVYAGTAATYGRGRAVVVATGMDDRVRPDRQHAADGRAGKDPAAGEPRQGRQRAGARRPSSWSRSSSASGCCAASRSWRCSSSASRWPWPWCRKRCRRSSPSRSRSASSAW